MGFVATGGTIVESNPASPRIGSRPLGITTYGGLVASYEALYRSQPNVRTVVDFLARNMAQLRTKLYRRLSDAERREERDHPLAVMLRHPNPRVSRFEFFRDLESDLDVFDNFVALKILAPESGRRALLRIPPQHVEPLGSNWLFPDGFRVTLGGRVLELPWDRFVHLKGYNPTDPRWGLSPIETLRRILSEEAAAGEAREQLWNRGARASAVVSRPADAPRWQDGARERFRQEFADAFTGSGPEAGGTPILEDGMTLEKVTLTPAELEYLEARKLSRAEVAAAYGVAPSNLGMMDSANIGDARAAHTGLYQDTLAPRTDFTSEGLALQLLPDFETDAAADDLYLEADLDRYLRGDFLAEAEATSKAVGAPIITRNEARARRNLAPVPGGDELITPLNVTTGGRSSPADTAPGTPGLGQASRKALARGAKVDLPASAANYPPELAAYADTHAAVLAAFVDRQSASVLSRLGAGDDPAAAFGIDADGRMTRWDGELADELAGVALAMAPDAAAPVADALGADFDLDVATPWLVNNARIAAEAFNEKTLAGVDDIWPAPLTAAGAVEDDDPTITGVFLAAGTWRAGALAVDRVGVVGNFSRSEAAAQAGATTKTWRTTSAHPRPSHSALNGVTIAANARFSNGGLWPHDPALSADEVGGCTCVVEFTETEASA